jgi:hypothetical protein
MILSHFEAIFKAFNVKYCSIKIVVINFPFTSSSSANFFYEVLMLHLMAVAYFSNNNNIVSRLGYSSVRKC